VHALVVVRTGVSAEAQRAHCAERLGGFKVPKAIAFTESLPRTASGKLQRARLAVDGRDAKP
jgi:O-succinylbenzoic acid--CoA ligase